jgi:altronate hydrolase
MAAEKLLKIDPKDNVLVALTDLPAGQPVAYAGQEYVPVSNVPAKQKFATAGLDQGDEIIMYGGMVGRAREPIRRGGLLSTRNVQHDSTGFSAKNSTLHWTPPDVARWSQRTFQGYLRKDRQVGTRNYWLVIPLVFCENRNLEVLRDAFEEELGYARPRIYNQQVKALVERHRKTANGAAPISPDGERVFPNRVFPNVDGIRFLAHTGGCGETRQDSRDLCGLLAGYIHHPNVAGATVLSLGCQNAQASILMEELGKRDPDLQKPVLIFDQQKTGLESEMLSQAIRATFDGLIQADRLERQTVSISGLTLGLKCGGSDGFSGISANPALGHASDILAAVGARSILSEFPELCGVEQNLIDRCDDPADGNRFIQLMQDYAARAKAVHSGFEMNPSPGNIADGLITDAMKSAGAARKGGTAPVCGVLDYPEYASRPGLNLLCSPGSDIEAVSAQVGAGANVVVFTTGLGTPTGNAIAPVIKVSTNTKLAGRMADIIDFDAGPIIGGETTVEQAGEALLDLVLKVASGEVATKAEQHGQYDFIPWRRGISL